MGNEVGIFGHREGIGGVGAHLCAVLGPVSKGVAWVSCGCQCAACTFEIRSCTAHSASNGRISGNGDVIASLRISRLIIARAVRWKDGDHVASTDNIKQLGLFTLGEQQHKAVGAVCRRSLEGVGRRQQVKIFSSESI